MEREAKKILQGFIVNLQKFNFQESTLTCVFYVSEIYFWHRNFEAATAMLENKSS
jgi:hypothetical protein